MNILRRVMRKLESEDAQRNANVQAPETPVDLCELEAAMRDAARHKDRGEFEQAQRLLDAAAQRFPNELPPALEGAYLAMYRHEWDDAIRRFESLRARFPCEPGPFLGAAEALEGAGRPGEARALVEPQTQRFPENPWPDLLLARLALAGGDAAEANARFQSALARSETSWQAYAAAANALAAHGKHGDADRTLIRGINRFPGELALCVAYARLASDRGEWQEALRRWGLARTKFPDALETYEGTANTLRSSGRRHRKVVVVYGNCQATSIEQLLSHCPSLAERFYFVHVLNHAPPGEEMKPLPPEVEDAVLLWEQFDEREDLPLRAELRSRVPQDCLIVTYPPIVVLGLWPFAWADSRNAPEPGFDWGRYPWGDRIGIEVAKSGIGPERALEKYMELSLEKMPDVEELIARDRIMAERRDAQCDVKMSEFVFSRLRDQHLFWTWGHAASPVIAELARQLCEKSKSVMGELSPEFEIEIEHVERLFPATGKEQLPIHPEVVRRLELTFCGPQTKYRWFDQSWSFEEYISRYIALDKSW